MKEDDAAAYNLLYGTSEDVDDVNGGDDNDEDDVDEKDDDEDDDEDDEDDEDEDEEEFQIGSKSPSSIPRNIKKGPKFNDFFDPPTSTPASFIEEYIDLDKVKFCYPLFDHFYWYKFLIFIMLIIICCRVASKKQSMPLQVINRP